MDIIYNNKKIERLLIILNGIVTFAVVASAIGQFGFYQPVFATNTIYITLSAASFFFIAEKIIRFINSTVKKEYLSHRWFELVFVALLFVLIYYSDAMIAMAIYLLLEIVAKICRTVVDLAASGKSPAGALVGLFVFLILCGTILLMLPKSSSSEPVGFVDALFTATSATCVTGLVVKDTGSDFSKIGQTIIIVLIQLGGLGIVIFGAVFALMFGRALNMRQSAAMQDLLNTQTASRIANMIAFIFITTITIEAIGAMCLFHMWEKSPAFASHSTDKWFYSIFHSISAFCNAGFGLFSKSLIDYNKDFRVYSVICPLIILGGLGFGVLYNLANVFIDTAKHVLKRKLKPHQRFQLGLPKKILLQSRIALVVSAILIIFGMLLMLIIQKNTGSAKISLADAFFQSVTARTAGFNTININATSDFTKAMLMLLMFIGGSPGSTAGGIKTVTLAVIIMAVYASIRKRSEVEIFKRSIPLVSVGKAITVVVLFAAVLLLAIFSLAITERHGGFEPSAIAFEAVSALGTVGLTCGITPALTTGGKIIIIITMLIGKLGPLTLLAMMTFNIKPARFNYPTEAIVVG